MMNNTRLLLARHHQAVLPRDEARRLDTVAAAELFQQLGAFGDEAKHAEVALLECLAPEAGCEKRSG